jgi:hydroxymethylpyrimidine/phosphomethylpyrimidine kinase
MPAVALSIAGSDPSGGAGIQADLKTFHQFGVYGEAVITLLTVQNTRRVSRVEVLPVDLVAEQIQAVIEDIPPAAAKTGALGSVGMIEAVAELARSFAFPLIVDPVMISKHGAPLLSEDGTAALVSKLLPQAWLVTPNIPEAEALTGLQIETPDDMAQAAKRLCAFGPEAALVKGGHRTGEAVDVLWWNGEAQYFSRPRTPTKQTHGTGCTLSAAITASLASGFDLSAAVERAKNFISLAIESAPNLGEGCGPVNHFAPALQT